MTTDLARVDRRIKSSRHLFTGDKVQVILGEHQGKFGSVEFVGTTEFASGNWVGIRLDGPHGKNDGSVQGVRYFNVEPKHGLFIKAGMLKLVEPSPTRDAQAAARASEDDDEDEDSGMLSDTSDERARSSDAGTSKSGLSASERAKQLLDRLHATEKKMMSPTGSYTSAHGNRRNSVTSQAPSAQASEIPSTHSPRSQVSLSSTHTGIPLPKSASGSVKASTRPASKPGSKPSSRPTSRYGTIRSEKGSRSASRGKKERPRNLDVDDASDTREKSVRSKTMTPNTMAALNSNKHAVPSLDLSEVDNSVSASGAGDGNGVNVGVGTSLSARGPSPLRKAKSSLALLETSQNDDLADGGGALSAPASAKPQMPKVVLPEANFIRPNHNHTGDVEPDEEGLDLVDLNLASNDGAVPAAVKARALALERREHREIDSDEEAETQIDEFLDHIVARIDMDGLTPRSRLKHITEDAPTQLPADIKLVVFGLGGTLCNDKVMVGSRMVPLKNMLVTSALKSYGIHIFPEDADKHRGRNTYDMLVSLLREHGPVNMKPEYYEEEAKQCLLSFSKLLTKQQTSMESAEEIPGASKVIGFLKKRGIKVALGSSYPREMVDMYIKLLGWEGLVDYMGSNEDYLEGRPNPAFIQDAMGHFGVTDACQVVKVGCTRAEVQEGRNAGAYTVAVSTGAQDANTLKKTKPDFLINSVADLPRLFQ